MADAIAAATTAAARESTTAPVLHTAFALELADYYPPMEGPEGPGWGVVFDITTGSDDTPGRALVVLGQDGIVRYVERQ